MCHPAVYAAVFIAQAYQSAVAANEEAERQNRFYKRQAELKQQQYMFQLERTREQRKRVGEAVNVEAEKYADNILDQKKQLIEARGRIQTLTGEGTGEFGSLMLGINRQGLQNLSRLESQFGSVRRNLANELTNIGFQEKDAQLQTQIGIESVPKAEGPSITSQLINLTAGGAQGYSIGKSIGSPSSPNTRTTDPVNKQFYGNRVTQTDAQSYNVLK